MALSPRCLISMHQKRIFWMIHSAVSSRQSEANALSRYNQLNTNTGVNNTASSTGTLSQKLSHAINRVDSRQSETDAASRYNTLNTNTGINNTASATGTLSQKLSHIISLFSTQKQKHLASKTVSVAVNTTGTHTLLNITGAGEFYMAYVNYMGDNYAEITFEIDGVSQMFRTYTNTSGYFAQRLDNISQLLGVSSGLGSWMPIHFNKSFKVTVKVSHEAERSFAAKYSIYE